MCKWSLSMRISHAVVCNWSLSTRIWHDVVCKWSLSRRIVHAVVCNWSRSMRICHDVVCKWPLSRCIWHAVVHPIYLILNYICSVHDYVRALAYSHIFFLIGNAVSMRCSDPCAIIDKTPIGYNAVCLSLFTISVLSQVDA